MTKEIPFTMPSGRALRQKPDLAMFPEALSAYGKGLGILARHLMWHHGQGVVTLGSSAEAMWQDLRAVALRNLAILPKAEHITGSLSYNLYRGSFADMKSAYKKSGLQLEGKIIVEDYAHRLSKMANLHGLFQDMGFPMRFVLLYAGSTAMWNIADYGMNVHVIINEHNPQLETLLATRRTPRKFGR